MAHGHDRRAPTRHRVAAGGLSAAFGAATVGCLVDLFMVDDDNDAITDELGELGDTSFGASNDAVSPRFWAPAMPSSPKKR